ncbi:succinyldiaminopimelate transaminase [Buchananella hordeovulneris]|uniref:succinyldiaminopimelate transaminase n=1 Tax=Buchananella hordeovulneris TaxID=52770 RepID=UPI0026DC8454|nr:succinyldiaminopimelate transaminase [Buchananella hordeovulneris]MDO5081116.1 succinyldiaminopimelate transaminase [Buchananella hordeovulneris]
MSALPRPLPLPDFPWDSLLPARAVAAGHPDGLVDLSVGTPVDATPAVAQAALQAGADAPGYPVTVGTPQVRQAICAWFARRRGVGDLTDAEVIPSIGSKEAVALLPLLLGVGPGDKVLLPQMAYPTYDVGARLAGATPVPVGPDPDTWPTDAALVWLNSPGNPHGHVLGRAELARIVQWGRTHGALIVNDECYAELAWSEPWVSQGVPSLLDPAVVGDSRAGVLALYSLSKQSNLAGYRAGIIAGAADLIAHIVEGRKHLGLLTPAPVQAAMVAALADDAHVARQRQVYGARRAALLPALQRAGLEVDPATGAGLYIWGRVPGCTGRQLVELLAVRGILVAPGDFYGEQAADFVRIALTASDERIAAAVQRLTDNPLTRG